MKRALKISLVAVVFLLTAVSAHAQELEVSGWVPYWSGTAGTKDARAHLDALTVVHPFAFSLKKDGALNDLAGLKKSTWRRLVSSASGAGVLVIPTVMTSNGTLVHTLLSDAKKREAHIAEIVNMVEKGRYDGVDIDYEGKTSKTRVVFATFLKELKEELGTKILSCTIEARTPPESLYRTPPANIEYANDYDAINDYCDRVNIMTYDQQRADLTLNDARKGAPYMPVADVDWVEKVMKLTMKSIDKEKLTIGVATYGREYAVTVAPDWYKSYDQQWAVNPSYAEKTAKKVKATISRNSAGEASYTYLPKSSKLKLSSYSIPSNTPKGNEISAKALAYANKTGKEAVFNVVWWSDAEAIQEKVELAKKLGVRGISIFKIDGGEDQDIWNLF